MTRRRAVALLCASTVMRRDADEIAYRWPPPEPPEAARARELNALAARIDGDVQASLPEAEFEAACAASHRYFYGGDAEC